MTGAGETGGAMRMGESYGRRAGGASVRFLQRALAGRLRGHAPAVGGRDAVLELAPDRVAAPLRCVDVPALESEGTAARPVGAPEGERFAAFLDGIQRSVVAWLADGVVPIVHAVTAAVVRVRQDRVMRTWPDGCTVEAAVYAPLAALRPEVRDAVMATGLPVVDTAPGPEGDVPRHPLEFTALAQGAVLRRREHAEEVLLARWCASESAPIYVDGGIRAAAVTLRGAPAVGVVKSHRTLYATPAQARSLVRLGVGERSPAVRIDARPGAAVASWYLRLREGGGADPFDGLVRLEVPEATFSTAAADDASRWVLAEREPVALPDPRWRVMAYGIRDCEEYLRAVSD